MNDRIVKRKILETSQEFKTFWRKDGPYAFALTSKEFPPVLLEPEEWLFSNDPVSLIKTLMQFDKKKMKFVHAPFNPKNKKILRPDKLSPWKINQFPEEWDAMSIDLFVPQGHLTLNVFNGIEENPEDLGAGKVEELFFKQLLSCLDQMGYLILSPQNKSKFTSINDYLDEWSADEKEAGLL